MNTSREPQPTAEQYWEIVDYLFAREMRSEGAAQGTDFTIHVEHYEVEARNENLMLWITERASGETLSFTIENETNRVEIAWIPRGPDRQAISDVEGLGRRYFADVLTFVTREKQKERRAHQKAGNFLTLENYQRVVKKVMEASSTPTTDSAQAVMQGVWVEYGEGRLLLRPEAGTKTYAVTFSLERDVRTMNPQDRKELNRIFEKLLQ